MWYVYWSKDKQAYQLTNQDTETWICVFREFAMAYDYVTKANKTQDNVSFSRWAQR
jgi:hypothetical protein